MTQMQDAAADRHEHEHAGDTPAGALFDCLAEISSNVVRGLHGLCKVTPGQTSWFEGVWAHSLAHLERAASATSKLAALSSEEARLFGGRSVLGWHRRVRRELSEVAKKLAQVSEPTGEHTLVRRAALASAVHAFYAALRGYAEASQGRFHPAVAELVSQGAYGLIERLGYTAGLLDGIAEPATASDAWAAFRHCLSSLLGAGPGDAADNFGAAESRTV